MIMKYGFLHYMLLNRRIHFTETQIPYILLNIKLLFYVLIMLLLF